MLIVATFLATVAAACPNCKNALPDTDDPGLIFRLRDGYVWSYIGMSSVPFLMAGTFGTVMYKRIKRFNGKQK